MCIKDGYMSVTFSFENSKKILKKLEKITVAYFLPHPLHIGNKHYKTPKQPVKQFSMLWSVV